MCKVLYFLTINYTMNYNIQGTTEIIQWVGTCLASS